MRGGEQDMVDLNRLKALMALKGLNGRKIAEKMDISSQRWYYKCNNQSFTLDDCGKLIKILEIDNPKDIFFADAVNCEITKNDE